MPARREDMERECRAAGFGRSLRASHCVSLRSGRAGEDGRREGPLVGKGAELTRRDGCGGAGSCDGLVLEVRGSRTEAMVRVLFGLNSRGFCFASLGSVRGFRARPSGVFASSRAEKPLVPAMSVVDLQPDDSEGFAVWAYRTSCRG